MPNELTLQTETLLSRYYNAEKALERHFQDLVASVQPNIRQRLASKGVTGDDLEDLLMEAMERNKIIEILKKYANGHPAPGALGIGQSQPSSTDHDQVQRILQRLGYAK